MALKDWHYPRRGPGGRTRAASLRRTDEARRPVTTVDAAQTEHGRPVPSRLANRLRRAASPVLVAGVLVWLVVAAVLAIALERERRQAVDHASQEASTLTAVVQQYTARTFDSVDITLSLVAAHLAMLEVEPDDSEVRELMRASLRHLPPVRALYVIGPDGWITHDTDYPATPRVSLADRSYFRQYLRDPGLEHALSPALQSRSGTGWFVAATRRISGTDGSFQGVVVAAVQLDWISRLFTSLQLKPGQTLALWDAGGSMLARYPPDDARIGSRFTADPVVLERIRVDQAGLYQTNGPPLGYPRIVSYRTLQSQPLAVSLTMPVETALRTWNRTAAGAGVALLLFTAAMVLGGRFFMQRQAENRRAVAHRVAQARATAAAEANAKFRTFFEQGSFFSYVLSREGTVLEANRAGLEACGSGRDKVIGRRFWECDWWPDGTEGVEAAREAVQAAAGGSTVRREFVYRLPEGASMQVELVCSPIRDESGQVLSVAAFGIDITGRKRQEAELRALADALTRANRHKGDFLATLSHELRNLLSPLQTGLAILERTEPGSPSAVRTMEVVKDQLSNMRRLLDDLLDIARVNTGKLRVDKERVDLRELLALAADAARSYMEGPSHRFTLSLPDEPLPVDVDRARIQQVLGNLLSNAAKYTPPGGHVVLSGRRAGAEVVVTVADDGIGIPAHARGKLFQLFEQVSENLPRSQGGLGIGLSLAQRLVAIHGGRIDAWSDGPGQGSTFTVRLPAADAPDAGLPAREDAVLK